MRTAALLFAFTGIVRMLSAQCSWTSVDYESFEYTAVIAELIPGTTYQNTPQTYAGCIRTGNYGMYMNIVDGYTGLLYSKTYSNICIGQNYRFSFSVRDAWSSTNNLTFNVYDGNNVLLVTQTVVTNSIWNDVVMNSFTSPTTSIRFEIVTNTAGGPGNDAGFDDLRLSQCQPAPLNYVINECAGVPDFDLYTAQSGTILSSNGSWSGPSSLQNGYLGTFSTASNTSGNYTYTVNGASGCADSSAVFTVQIFSTPTINPTGPLENCQQLILPAITGSDLSSQAAYYSSSNGMGTSYAPGAVINTSQTLYMYDGTTGCSDEEPVSITISQPYSAGADNSISFCTPIGILDLNLLVNGNTGPGGTWAETSNPASGAFSPGSGNLDTDNMPSGVYTFTFTAPANGSCPTDEALFTIAMGGQLSVDLGNDTTFCQGQGVTLSPGVYDSYLWDNNSTNPTRYVSAPGTYWVRVGTTGDNLIVNGDFEQGNTEFTTNYTVGSGGAFGQLTNPGTYAITTSPNLVHNNFTACTDHTADPGANMMVVNGSGTPNTNVWCQSVPVQPNTDYQFGTWVSSALTDANVAQLQFNINSSSLGSVFSPPPTGCQWVEFYQVWNSGMNVSAQICIVNQNTSGGGNDFVIDDISFAPICYASDTIVIGNYPQPAISVSPNDTICSGEIAQLTASSATPGLTYTWNPGAINGNPLNVSPVSSTVYTVSAVSPEGCTSNSVSRSIIVRPTPQASIFINGNDTICNGATVLLDGTSTVPSSTLVWSPSGNSAAQESVTPSVTSAYTLTATTPFGCQDDTTITIFVIPDLDVSISGTTTFCESSGSTLTASSNQTGMLYQWLPSGQTGSQLNVNAQDAGWIYLTGNYFFCPQAIDSVEISISPNPQVTVPSDVEVCPGEPVTMTVASDQPGSTFSWTPGNLSGAVNTLTVNSSTTYTVIAQNGDCVSAPATFSINVSGACYLIVPNVFTPNGDASNDFFQLVSYEGISTLECVIINRWGSVIREFDTPDFHWDGTDKAGRKVSEGVYFYKITAVTKAGEVLNEQGMVELVN